MRAKQLVAETRSPLPAEPGQAERFDYEYGRCGTANLSMLFEPLAGKRHVKVTERRTAVDFAHVIRDLADVHYPDAEKIVLVMDNLNTHKPAALYQAFAPEEARRLTERLEIHHTPKHGSWLDMAEIELSALATQCLDRRIADAETLASEVAAGRSGATRTVAQWTGASKPKMPASNSSGFTRQFSQVRALGQCVTSVKNLKYNVNNNNLGSLGI